MIQLKNGDRVAMVQGVQRSRDSPVVPCRGVVIDTDFDQRFALVRWEDDRFNTDVSRFIDSRLPDGCGRRQSIFGSVVSKSELVKERDEISPYDLDFRRNSAFFAQKEAFRRANAGDLVSSKGYRSQDGVRDTQNYRLDGENSEICANSGCFRAKSEFLDGKDDKSYEESAKKRIKYPMRCERSLSTTYDRVKRMGEDLYNNEFRPRRGSCRIHDSDNAQIEYQTRRDCSKGHLMVRWWESSDDYGGDGVECDECGRRNIHLTANGFFHCKNCARVDLCEGCASLNVRRSREESPQQLRPGSAADMEGKPEASENSMASISESESDRIRSTVVESSKDEDRSAESRSEDTVLCLPKFWFSLYDKTWIADRDKCSKKKKEEAHFNLIEKVNKHPEEAFKIYQELIHEGSMPNSFTFFIVFKALRQLKTPNLDRVHELVVHMDTLEIDPPLRTVNALLSIFDESRLDWKKRYERRFGEALQCAK